MTTFQDIGLRPRTLENLQRNAIATPLPVQSAALPPLLAGRDVVIEAPTGSGKTLAFLAPLIERLAGHKSGAPRAMVLTPTRELARQIADVLHNLDRGLGCTLLYGGVGYGGQMSALRNGTDVIIGCPGRILDLAQRQCVRLHRIEYLVLDEADEMLDRGFAHDIESIISMTPQQGNDVTRQTVLASATMPQWVGAMIRKNLHDPHTVTIDAHDDESTLEHGLLSVQHADKVGTLSRLLKQHSGSVLVFHRTKHGAKKLHRDLSRLGHASDELQGNLSQTARDRAIAAFRQKKTDVLVATNVAARGLDVAHVGLVVNYELPDTPEWLTHRVGRTARNGAQGRALTMISEDDHAQWRKLRRLGAPDLQEVDHQRLLHDGQWQYVSDADRSVSLPHSPTFAQPERQHRFSGKRSPRPRAGGSLKPTRPHFVRPPR